MNPPRLSTLKWGSVAGVALGAALATYVLWTDPNSAPRVWFDRYAASLERRCRLLYLPRTGAEIARHQAAIIGLLLMAALVLEEFLLVAPAAVMVVAPRMWLDSKVAKRKIEIDVQLETFLLTLSNSLRATPSLGDAMAATANLLRPPIKQDIDFVLKENRLGAPLDQALLNMSARVESRSFSSALVTILIGRQTGGDLPAILDRSAGALREMTRLEGVLRAKTAEGRAQANVLAGVPFVIILALSFIAPSWLAPLTTTFVGYGISAVAAALWVAAIFVARRILDVDM